MSAKKRDRQGKTYTGTDLSRVVKNDDLSVERGSLSSGLVLGVGTDCKLASVYREGREEGMKEVKAKRYRQIWVGGKSNHSLTRRR